MAQLKSEKIIKGNQKWFSHVKRKPGSRIAKEWMEKTVDGSRPVGKTVRFCQEVSCALKSLKDIKIISKQCVQFLWAIKISC